MGEVFDTDIRGLQVREHDLEWWLDLAPSLRWHFAQTMQQYPHSYVVRRRTLAEADYVRAFGVVRTFGQPAMFNGRTQVYLHDAETDWRWWPMSRHHWQSGILNVSKDGKMYGPQTAPGTLAPTFTHYDRVAAYYDDVYRDLTDTEKQALWKAIVTTSRGSRPSALDLGAGTGGTIDTRAVNAADTVVVDPSQGMLNDLVVKHPTVKRVEALTAEEYLAMELGETFDVVTASYGSASYFEPAIIPELPYLARHGVVLSFYAVGTRPLQHQLDGMNATIPPWESQIASQQAAQRLASSVERRGRFITMTIEGKAGRA